MPARGVASAGIARPEVNAAAPLPLDRGWAWVIALAASGIYGLPVATVTCTGMIYVETLEAIGGQDDVTFWAFTFGGMMALLSGPAVSRLVSKTSHRMMMAIGSLCLSIGIGLTGVISAVEQVFLTWGIYGFGLGCLLLTSLTCTSQYFTRYHGLSVGIVSCGGGILSLVMPLVLRLLFDAYSFAGGMLIFGGLMLHALPLALLVRPIRCFERKSSGSTVVCVTVPDRCISSSFEEQCQQAAAATGGTGTPAHASASESSAPEADTLQTRAANIAGIIPALTDYRFSCHSALGGKMDAIGGGNSAGGAVSEACQQAPKSTVKVLADHRTWIVAVTALILELGMSIVFLVVPPYADASEVAKQTVSDLLSMSGGVQVIFVPFHGWISDRKLVSSMSHISACCLATGLSAFICVVTPDPAWGIGMLAVSLGATGTAVYSLMPVMINELLGSDAMESVTGIQMASQSVGLVSASLISGAILQTTGSWTFVLYYIGSMLIIAALVVGGYRLWQNISNNCFVFPSRPS